MKTVMTYAAVDVVSLACLAGVFYALGVCAHAAVWLVVLGWHLVP